jgi:hypothetical protein
MRVVGTVLSVLMSLRTVAVWLCDPNLSTVLFFIETRAHGSAFRSNRRTRSHGFDHVVVVRSAGFR